MDRVEAFTPDALATPARRAPRPARAWLLLALTLLLGGIGFGSAVLALPHRDGPLAPICLLLLLLSYGRTALSASGPLLGLLPRPKSHPAAVPFPHLIGRARPAVSTAILLPIFNEPAEPVAAALRVMADALLPEDNVAFFVLSDTQDPALARIEAGHFPPHGRSASGVDISYRRRAINTRRKAGNIDRFCQDHGHEFDFALVLDADSLMTAASIRGLIDRLRDDPALGLVQSVSYPIGGTTLFARLQQFGARLNTPLSVVGQDLWQGRRGTYWGHNAVLRLRPFMEHAGLPLLPGRPPLGGEILCHDTVEAALLLRGGWEVGLDTEIEGSFETTPSNLVDHLARERRWCQGNLQHLRLLAAPGLVPESRLHLGMGVLYYLASPIGLLLSLALLLSGLLPSGPASPPPPGTIWFCAGCILVLLLAPKLASLARVLLRWELAAGFGGRARLIASVLLEQVASTVLAPVMLLSITLFVVETFCGRTAGWTTPPRGDRPLGWREAARRFSLHTGLGAAAALALLLARPGLLPWSIPLLLGPILSIPLARWSASVRLGLLARRLGLFLTVDELAPVPEQVAFAETLNAMRRPAR